MRRDLLCDGVVNCMNDEDPDTCDKETRDTSDDKVDNVTPDWSGGAGAWFYVFLVMGIVTSMTSDLIQF